MKNILLLGSQHGNERLGDYLYEYIKRYRSDLIPHISFHIANPLAHLAKKRYIESDMNRSYVTHPKTYEENVAMELLQYISDGQYDIVLDLHTTTCRQPPSILIIHRTREVNSFLDASSMSHIMHMKDSIAKQSLLHHCKQTVSIEISINDLNILTYELLTQDIDRYISNERSKVRHNHYEIYGRIFKDEISGKQTKALVNLVKTTEGYYPYLVGENSYKKQTDYLGFKASKL